MLKLRSAGCRETVREAALPRPKSLAAHSKQNAGRAGATPIPGAGACPCSLVDKLQRFEFAARAYPQTPPELPASRSYSPAQSPPRTRPHKKEEPRQVTPTEDLSKFALSQRINCIGEKSQEKAAPTEDSERRKGPNWVEAC